MDTFVELVCPACEKHWERDPNRLSDPNEPFTCPDCGARRDTSEFMRTDTDLGVLEDIRGMREGAHPNVETEDGASPNPPGEEDSSEER